MTTLKVRNKYTRLRGKYLANGGEVKSWQDYDPYGSAGLQNAINLPGYSFQFQNTAKDLQGSPTSYSSILKPVNTSGIDSTAQQASNSNKFRDFKNVLSQNSSLSGLLNTGANVIGSAIGSGISGGKESGVGNAIGSAASTIGGAIGKVNPLLGAAVTGVGKVVGGLTNGAFGTKWNDANIATVEGNINRLNSFQSNANNYDTLAKTWNSTQFANNFSDSYIGKQGWFRNNVSSKAEELRDKQTQANNFAYRALEDNATNIRNKTMSGLERGYMGAYGGFLHGFGGELDTHGSQFSTGANRVNTGGTHESNPYGGVLMGRDAQGTPDIVEQNEVIKDGYVYSNRLNVPEELRKKYGLKKSSRMSYADAVTDINKKAEERPNDFITSETQDEIFNEFRASQEEARIKKMQEEATMMSLMQAQNAPITSNMEQNMNPMEAQQEPEEQGQPEEAEGQNAEYPENLDQAAVNSTPEFAYGGYLTGFKDDNMNYFDKGGDKYYKYSNKVTKGDPLYNYYKDYLDPNGEVDFSRLYDPSSEWYKTRESFLETLKDKGDLGKRARQWYADQLNAYNAKFKDKKGNKYTKVTPAMITPEFVAKMSSDRKLGFGHNVIANRNEILPYTPETIDQYYLRDLKNHTASIMKDTPWEGTRNGYSYSDMYPYKNTGIVETVMGKDGKRYRKHYWDPTDNASTSSTSTTLGDAKKKFDVLPTWQRQVPIIGLAGITATDALGLTNKPDYAEADALLNGYAKSGAYMPVDYNNISNKLAYNPMSVDYGINTLNAGAGATRRAMINQGYGNRGTMAGILAADNQYLNNLGNNRTTFANANLEQKTKVGEFNRSTNQMNSSGQLQADTANQSAFNRAKEAYLTGLGSALAMRSKAKSETDATKSANMSGLLNSIGALGKENFTMNQINSNPALYYTTGANGVISYGNVYNTVPKNTITTNAKYGGLLKK